MPVLSLPEFLGLQEAPQAPVFQRTNQLRRPTDWERFAQMADAVTALRQQRPMAQIQAIQNEYDTIRDNADKLRRERETTMQAEQAVSALAGLTPESDDYLTQRRRIMTQFPSAVLDPRVQSVIDDSDRMFNTRQSAMARMEEERLQAENRRAQEEADRRAELASLGVFDPNERARLAKSSELTGEEKFRRSQKPEGVTKDKALDTIINQAFAEFDAQYMPPEGMSDPTEIAIDKSAKKYALNQRLLERFGAAKPQETAPPPTTAPQIQIPFRPDFAPVAPKSFKDTMKKGAFQAPKVGDILKVTDDEVINDINSPDATEDTFTTAIADPNTSEKVKTAALERLRQFAKEPKFPLGTTSREARNRIASLQEKIKEGEKLIRMGPEIQKYREAWTAEKNDIASDIEAYAKSLGLDTDLIAADLAKNEPLTDDPENPFTIRDDFNKFLKGKLDKKAAKLEPFAKSEFAKELGERVDVFTSLTPTGVLGQVAQAFGILPNAQKSYGDVLDVYLNEKFGQNQPATSNPVAPAVKPSNIKSITPID